MAKTTTPRRKTAEQLKSTVWPDEKTARAELKASGLPPSGEDYELGEHGPGSWQLIARDAPAKPAPIREQAVIDSLKRKPGAPPRGEAKVIAEAAAPARVVLPNGRHQKKPAVTTKPQPVPRPAVRAAAPALKESLFNDEPETPEAGEAAKLPMLFTPLPNADGPYELTIREGDPGFPKTAAHTAALDLSRKLKTVVQVRDKTGKTVRTYDWADIQRQQDAHKKATAGERKTGRPARTGESKFHIAAKLLFRSEGATAAQLENACGWDRVGQRHINRASKMNANAKIESLGDRHWRLISRAKG